MLEGMGEETRTKCESGSEGSDKVTDTVQDGGGIEKASFGMWPVTDSPSGALGVGLMERKIYIFLNNTSPRLN